MKKKLCLGTYLHILTQGINGKQKDFFKELFSCIGSYYDYFDETLGGHLKSGKNNLTGFDEIKTYDKVKLVDYFNTRIIPSLKNDCKRQIVLAFRDVLSDDEIDDLTVIGFNDAYTKKDIINATKFDLADLLANIFYYCCVEVKNIPYQENIKEVKDKDYIHSFDSEVDSILWDKKPSSVVQKLDATVNKKLFHHIFEEVKCLDLSIPNNNELRTYILDVVGNEFDYENIKKFIRTNIGRYVFSRCQRNNYKISDNIESLSADAISAYHKRIEKDITTNHFNEMMLYLFLECVLGAPKIYSKMELQNMNSTYESLSAGIHLLLLRNGVTACNQLLFGATETIDNIQEAIDSAFSQIGKIKDSRADEYNLVESTIMNIVPDTKTIKELESIILPQKSSTDSKPDQAFGIFLGYTIEVENADSLTREQFIKATKEKIEKDILNFMPYIIKKIETLRLKAHSFYIYVLPLNNASIDKDEIMKKALEV